MFIRAHPERERARQKSRQEGNGDAKLNYFQLAFFGVGGGGDRTLVPEITFGAKLIGHYSAVAAAWVSRPYQIDYAAPINVMHVCFAAIGMAVGRRGRLVAR